MKKKIIITISIILVFIVFGLYVNKSKQIKDINVMFDLKEEARASLEQQLATQMQENDNQISLMQTQLDDIAIENERLYNLIESTDTNMNIEDYFGKVCYLTFDDGPSHLTKRVLNILDENNIKGTFFVVYTEYGVKNNMYQEIIDRGHAIGNHTYSHTKPYKNWDKYFEDMYKLEDFLFERIGQRPKILRFPAGSTNSWNDDEETAMYIDKLHAMGYEFFDWNVSTSDGGSGPITSEEIYNNVKSRSKRGKVKKLVVLMHDRGGKETSIDALSDIIYYLKACGYTFLPLNEDSFAPQIYGEH